MDISELYGWVSVGIRRIFLVGGVDAWYYQYRGTTLDILWTAVCLAIC